MISIDIYAGIDEAKQALETGHLQFAVKELRSCIFRLERAGIYPSIIDSIKQNIRAADVMMQGNFEEDLENSKVFLRIALSMIETLVEICEDKGLKVE